MTESPLASVVVPVRNEAPCLPVLVEALRAQTLGRDQFEVVLADDGSTDGGPDRFCAEEPWLRVVSAPPENEYAALNRGVGAAGAPAVAFCGADCRPEPDWLERGLASLATADLVGGNIAWELPTPRSVWSLLEMEAYIDQESSVRGGKAVTGNLFVRREVFDRAGRFDTSRGSGGDVEFVRRAVRVGGRLVYAQDAVVWHPTHDAALPFLRKVWRTERGWALARMRAGPRPPLLQLRALVPVVPTLRARRRAGRTLGLDSHYLAHRGARPRALERARALPLLYLVVPPVRIAGQLSGWRAARQIGGAN